jgi:hypothetical protein
VFCVEVGELRSGERDGKSCVNRTKGTTQVQTKHRAGDVVMKVECWNDGVVGISFL